jgi:hypothetical protein
MAELSKDAQLIKDAFLDKWGDVFLDSDTDCLASVLYSLETKAITIETSSGEQVIAVPMGDIVTIAKELENFSKTTLDRDRKVLLSSNSKLEDQNNGQ